jgi:signal transduction histidine kinase
LRYEKVVGTMNTLVDRSARRSRMVRAGVFCGLLLMFYAAWKITRWGGAAHKTLIGDLSFIPINLAAIVAAVCAARRSRAVARVRLSWQLLAVGLALYLLGDVVQTYYEVVARVKPYPSLGDLGYLGFYPVTLVALLLIPVSRRSWRERLTLALDCTLVALSGALPIWYFSLAPTIVAGGQGVIAMAVSLAYPVGDMVLLVGLAALLLRGVPTGMRASLNLVGIGLVGFVVTDLVYGWVALHSGYAGGDLVDAGWMVSLAFFVLAANAQPLVVVEAAKRAEPLLRRRVSWLPYVGLAANISILIYIERHDGPTLLVVFASLGALVALVSIRQMLVQFELLEAQRALREAQADRAVLLERTISRGEEERTRIAVELHDGPVQRLAALVYLLERSARLTRRGESGGLSLVDEALDQLGNEVDGLRRMMSDLRPPALDESGLENALKDSLANVFRWTDVRFEFSGRVGSDRLPTEVETVLYRVAHEALVNCARHASATRVRVTLDRIGSSVILSVEDDGIGFTRELARARLRDGHFGLVGMRERIELGGGTWDIDSTPGHGTRINATLPIEVSASEPSVMPFELELVVPA